MDVPQGYEFVIDDSLAGVVTCYCQPALIGYDLTTAIGPVLAGGAADLVFSFPTRGGPLAFSAFDGVGPGEGPPPINSLTFTATIGAGAVPEPSSLALLAAALVSLGVVRRRKRL